MGQEAKARVRGSLELRVEHQPGGNTGPINNPLRAVCSSQATSFTAQGSTIAVPTPEIYLGVIVNTSPKTSTQCSAAIKGAYEMLGITKENEKNKNIIKLLHQSMVCPHNSFFLVP